MSLVLYGDYGIGKSTFPKILGILLGENETDYFTMFDTIDDLKNKFNANMMTNIITAVEEIPTNASNFHSFWTKMNALITGKYVTFEKKGIDCFTGQSLNNFILITNFITSIFMPAKQRRYICSKVSNKYEKKANFLWLYKKM